MATIHPSIKSRQQHLMARRFGEDVANRVTNRAESPPLSASLLKGTPDTLKVPTRRSFRISAARSSSVPKSNAVPFPTIREEGSEDEDGLGANSFDPTTEDIRGKEWAEEIARRQASIKELRDRKLRLEQTHNTTRARKSSPPSAKSYSYFTSPNRKFSADDVEFLSALHASVVWRLWHMDLSSEVFTSERLLATRLHLVLMRYGRQNIPVPPIVSLSMSHHLASSQALQAGSMIAKDRPGIQSLPQLVAKSLLRQGKPRKSLARKASNPVLRSEAIAQPSSPLAKETISPNVDGSILE